MADILKFEYMTQLLLDSNYLPLILKMFAHQDVDHLITQQNDRKEYRFVSPIVDLWTCSNFRAASSISVGSTLMTHLKRTFL